MNDHMLEKKMKILGKIVSEVANDLSFTILEIGALPLEGQEEPFHQFIDMFPESQIIAFEVDKDLCNRLNQNTKPGITYYPVALGRTEQRCNFYETNHPACCSLYKPNEKLMRMYNGLEVAMLKSVSSVKTFSLDGFIKGNNIGSVDFIKIDIQGAELDVFQGGINTLKDVISIVSEVEFIPLYLDQPLFGDVCAFLTGQGMIFHKFLGIAGRTLKPITIRNNPNFPTQHMWSDAVFIRDIVKIAELPSSKLLKMGLIAYIYGSPDVAIQCFKIYDKIKGTRIHPALFELGVMAN